jgi:hypothetical protein
MSNLQYLRQIERAAHYQPSDASTLADQLKPWLEMRSIAAKAIMASVAGQPKHDKAEEVYFYANAQISLLLGVEVYPDCRAGEKGGQP